MNIALIEPFYSGSHKVWADGLKDHLSYELDLYTLPGRHWKWRMHGGAVSLARKLLEANKSYDLIITTDMVDVPVFRALIREKYGSVPVVLYFHENQLTYPWSPNDEDVKLERDNHYAFINYTSALAADYVWFNSEYHKRSFLQALPEFLRSFPDFRETDNTATIRNKSSVLHLGLDLNKFDKFKTNRAEKPLILWNHRWEYDKNPEDFFQTMFDLQDRNFNFDLVVLGEEFSSSPAIFEEAKSRLSEKIIHWGFVRNFSDYAKWLWKADILPVTSRQDFFGISVVEATYCNTIPIVPDRLAYPEYIPEQNIFKNKDHLIDLITNYKNLSVPDVSLFDWKNKIGSYNEKIQNTLK